jgi:hypothetical protein
MSQKQKNARNDYVLTTNVQKDFDGMVEEMEKYYNEIIKESGCIV